MLFRLGQSAARDRCILKGASLLTVWLPDPYRATRDIDLLLSGQADDEAIRSLVTEVCAEPSPEDGLFFDLSELVVETIRPEEEYSGKRARFQAMLGGARIAVQLDFGIGDALAVAPEEIVYPRMLETTPSPRLRAYPREATIAEKFEAMITFDTRNSRMKDFHDVWALAGAFEFDGRLLQESVVLCFSRRGTPWSEEQPRALTPAFYQLPELQARWQNYLASGAVLEPPPTSFGAIGERIIQFLGPIRRSVLGGTVLSQAWPPAGQWTDINGAHDHDHR